MIDAPCSLFSESSLASPVGGHFFLFGKQASDWKDGTWRRDKRVRAPLPSTLVLLVSRNCFYYFCEGISRNTFSPKEFTVGCEIYGSSCFQRQDYRWPSDFMVHQLNLLADLCETRDFSFDAIQLCAAGRNKQQTLKVKRGAQQTKIGMRHSKRSADHLVL